MRIGVRFLATWTTTTPATVDPDIFGGARHDDYEAIVRLEYLYTWMVDKEHDVMKGNFGYFDYYRLFEG